MAIADLFPNDPLLAGIGRTARAARPQIPPEVADSLLDKMLGGTMSGLQWVGETLDKPGRAWRGLLYDKQGNPGGGDVSALLNLIPFSDTMGWTDPKQSVQEADLREGWGLSANTGNEWADTLLNLATDVAIGVAHDPLTLLTGSGKALTKAGIAARNAGERVATARRALTTADELLSGGFAKNAAEAAQLERDIAKGIASITVADPTRPLTFSDEFAQAGKNAMMGTSHARRAEEIRQGLRGQFGVKIPFAQDPLFSFNVMPKEWAAKLTELTHYGAASPVPYVRQLFSTEVRGQAPWAQRITDKAHSEMLDAGANIVDKSLAIDKRINELSDLYDHHIKTWLKDNPDVAREITGGAPVDNMTANSFVRALAELKAGPPAMRQAVDAALNESREAARRVTAARTLSVETGAQGANPNRFARTPNVTIVGEEHIANAINEFDKVALASIQTKDEVFNLYRSYGGDAAELDDEFINHFPRRLSELMAQQMGKGKANKYAKDVWGAIQRHIRDIDGGTYKVNAMSMDPRVTGWWHATDEAVRDSMLAQSENILAAEYGLPTAKQVLDANGFALVDENGRHITENVARKFAGYLAKLPEEVTAEGLFSRSLTTDLMDYSLNMMRRANGLQGVHRLAVEVATTDVEIGPTVAELFDSLKMTDTGVQKFLGDYAAKHGLDPANLNPRELYVPQAMGKAAERMMHYNKRPDETIGILKAYDNLLGLHKAGLYSPWVASHVRNGISGLWQNMALAFRGPADATAAFNEVRRALSGKGNQEWMAAFKAHALHSGLQIDDMLQVMKAQTSDTATWGTLGGALSDYTLGTLKNVGQVAKKSLHPIKSAKELFTEEGFRGAVREFGPFKGGHKIGEFVEFVNRYSHFVALKRRGWTNAAAARSVKLAHFDYSPQALTPFEQQFMRRLIPFYRFMRGNLPLQLRSLIDEPGGRTAQTIRAINSLREQKSQEADYIPNYLSEGLAIPLGSPEAGMQNFYVSSEILPVEEAFNRLSFFGGLPDTKKIAESYGAATTPFISTPLQAMSGRQWWSHRNIGDLYQTPTENQNLNFWLANTPAARALSTERMLTDSRKTMLQKLVNATLGGGRFTTVDIPKWMNIEAREVLERNLEPSANILQGDYLFAPDETKLTEEQIIQLSLLRQLQNENRKMNKERKAREGR